jgi:hypothetical protein
MRSWAGTKRPHSRSDPLPATSAGFKALTTPYPFSCTLRKGERNGRALLRELGTTRAVYHMKSSALTWQIRDSASPHCAIFSWSIRSRLIGGTMWGRRFWTYVINIFAALRWLHAEESWILSSLLPLPPCASYSSQCCFDDKEKDLVNDYCHDHGMRLSFFKKFDKG